MGSPRLALVEALLALRWPGALGAALLLAAAGYGAAVPLPQREALVALRAKADALERRAAAVRSGAEAAPQGPAARRAAFFAALPARADLTQHIERIYAAAALEQLSLAHGEYTAADVAGTGLVRLRITLPVKGSYRQVRRFVDAAIAAVPGLALDDLSLQRPHVGETQVEAKVQLSLFLVN
jgi:hypothetical protein